METDKDSLLLGNKAKTSTISCKSCHSTLWLYLLAAGKMFHLPKIFCVVAEKSLLTLCQIQDFCSLEQDQELCNN